MLTFSFRLPPGPETVRYARLAEEIGYEGIWIPEVPAFGHDIWISLAQVAEATSHIRFGPAVLIPSYRHPLAQASAIATLEAFAPGRLRVGFGTGFTGRSGLGKPPLTLPYVRRHIEQVRGLLQGEAVDIDGGMAQILATDGWLAPRPVRVPLLLAAQGPRGRQLAREVADGLIALGGAAPGFDTCLVSVNGTVMDDDEDWETPRVRAATAPLVASAYHGRWARDPASVRELPNGAQWLESVERLPEDLRHLSVHRGHNLEIVTGHDELVDTGLAAQMSFSGTRDKLRAGLDELEAAGATGVIFGTSGVDVERELRAFAEVAGVWTGLGRHGVVPPP